MNFKRFPIFDKPHHAFITIGNFGSQLFVVANFVIVCLPQAVEFLSFDIQTLSQHFGNGTFSSTHGTN
jgi:hypothetical protein